MRLFAYYKNISLLKFTHQNAGSAGTLLILVMLLLFLLGLFGVRIVSNPAAVTKIFSSIKAGNSQSAVAYTASALIGFDMTGVSLDDPAGNNTELQTPPFDVAPLPPSPTPSAQSLWSLIPILKTIDTTNKLGNGYKLTYFDIDSAKDKRFVTATIIDSERERVIQDILSTAHVRPAIIEEYALVFTSVPAEGTKSFSTTILLRNKPVPIPEIGMTEGGKLNDFHKYILIRGSLREDELADTLMHEVGHIVGNMLTAEQFKSYMLTRSMPPTLVDSWRDYYIRNRTGEPAMNYGNWAANPGEDFAEVFKTIYGKKSWTIHTQYGPVTSQTEEWFGTEVNPLVTER